MQKIRFKDLNLSFMVLLLTLNIFCYSLISYTYAYLSSGQEAGGILKAAHISNYLNVKPGSFKDGEDNDSKNENKKNSLADYALLIDDLSDFENTNLVFTLINITNKSLNINYELKGDICDVLDYSTESFVLLPNEGEKIAGSLESDESSFENTYLSGKELIQNEVIRESIYLNNFNFSSININSIHKERPEYDNYYHLKLHLKFKSNIKPGIYKLTLVISVNGKFLTLEIPISITVEDSLQKSVEENVYKISEPELNDKNSSKINKIKEQKTHDPILHQNESAINPGHLEMKNDSERENSGEDKTNISGETLNNEKPNTKIEEQLYEPNESDVFKTIQESAYELNIKEHP